jgi:hypothetical protein
VVSREKKSAPQVALNGAVVGSGSVAMFQRGFVDGLLQSSRRQCEILADRINLEFVLSNKLVAGT